MVVMTIGWCVSGTATAFAIPRVFYGLRAEVKSAMRLGHYTLEGKIGEGGMLSTEKHGPPNARRFEREVQITSKLTHPGRARRARTEVLGEGAGGPPRLGARARARVARPARRVPVERGRFPGKPGGR